MFFPITVKMNQRQNFGWPVPQISNLVLHIFIFCMKLKLFYLKPVSTLLCKAVISFFMVSLASLSFFSLCSAVLLLRCFLYHCGLSYIMHVKQTHMSESLKGSKACPLATVPGEVGSVGSLLQRLLCADWPQLNYSQRKKLCRGKCIYTTLLRWRIFHNINW